MPYGETVVFVLNVLAFVFIGLQIRPIVVGLDPAQRLQYLYLAAAVLLTVIVVRFAWVTTYKVVSRLEDPIFRLPSTKAAPATVVGRRVDRLLVRYARACHLGRRVSPFHCR